MNTAEEVDMRNAQKPGFDPMKTAQTWLWRRVSPACTYPFGQDPVWSVAENHLTLTNNIKMKLSLIFGVLHMTFGIICKGSNLIMKKMWLELVTEVIGGFLLLWFLMGLMDLLIIAKWFKIPDIDDCSSRQFNPADGADLCIGDF